MSPFSYFVKSFPELTTLDEMLTFLLFLDDFDSQLLLLVLDLFLGGGVCLLLKFQITLVHKSVNAHVIPILKWSSDLFIKRVEVFSLIPRLCRPRPRWIR